MNAETEKRLAQRREWYRRYGHLTMMEMFQKLDDLAAQVEKAWRPIETAPKDGTKILVTDRNVIGCEECVFWDDEADNPGWSWATDDGPYYANTRFTDWMPLPAPPTFSSTK